jgi:hypothetical protein
MVKNREPFDTDTPDNTLASAARTTSSTGTAFDTGDLNSVLGVLTVTAHSGTTPTLDTKLQTSLDGGTTWADVASFAQVTTTDGVTRKLFGPVGSSCRWSWTVGGTTPSYTFKIDSYFNRDD